MEVDRLEKEKSLAEKHVSALSTENDRLQVWAIVEHATWPGLSHVFLH